MAISHWVLSVDFSIKWNFVTLLALSTSAQLSRKLLRVALLRHRVVWEACPVSDGPHCQCRSLAAPRLLLGHIASSMALYIHVSQDTCTPEMLWRGLKIYSNLLLSASNCPTHCFNRQSIRWLWWPGQLQVAHCLAFKPSFMLCSAAPWLLAPVSRTLLGVLVIPVSGWSFSKGLKNRLSKRSNHRKSLSFPSLSVSFCELHLMPCSFPTWYCSWLGSDLILIYVCLILRLITKYRLPSVVMLPETWRL